MFRKHIGLILLLMISFSTAQSQNVPGYMGKRAFVDYNFNAPFLGNLGPKFTNFFHNFNFNYVIKRRSTVGLSVDVFSLLNNRGGSSFSNTEVESDIKGTAIGINFDRYNKRSIAPVGGYWRFSSKYIIAEYVDIVDDPFINGTYTVTEKINRFVFTIGYGVRRVFFDRMMFNVGGSVSWVPGTRFDESGYAYTLGSTYFWRMNVGVGVLLF